MIIINDFEDFDIKKIADSGQCFRIKEVCPGKWRILAVDKLSYLFTDNDTIKLDCADEDNRFWSDYFDLGTDYSTFRKSVDKNDIFLSEAVEYGQGIRILKQDPWEMLITFIISQRRSIPSIKTCVERLCERWGTELENGVFGFPSPKQLSDASLKDLEECGLGYRAEYVYLACKAVYEQIIDLDALRSLPDEDLFCSLLSFRGVGAKVANCVSLFGFYRIAAFPVDVWIDRVQKQFYNGHFPIEKYKGFAGIMQQFIFYYIRKK